MIPWIVLQLGASGSEEPVIGGLLVFGLAGLSMLYLSFVRTEMDAGPVLKASGFVFLAMALLSFFWPYRPW